MRLTFKKEPREPGLAAIGIGQNVKIKADGKKVGWIQAWSWRNSNYSVWLHVKGNDGNPNCDWHNECVKNDIPDEQAARLYVKTHWEELQAKGLHQFDGDD